jgi:hypothetical protein
MVKVEVSQLSINLFNSSHIISWVSSWLSIFCHSIKFSRIRILEDRWKSSSVFGIEFGYLPAESSKCLCYVQSLSSMILPFPLCFASDKNVC